MVAMFLPPLGRWGMFRYVTQLRKAEQNLTYCGTSFLLSHSSHQEYGFEKLKSWGLPRICKSKPVCPYTRWRGLWSPVPLIIIRVMASEGTGKTVGQLMPVRSGKPSHNTQLPVFPQDYDVVIGMFIECLHRYSSKHCCSSPLRQHCKWSAFSRYFTYSNWAITTHARL